MPEDRAIRYLRRRLEGHAPQALLQADFPADREAGSVFLGPYWAGEWTVSPQISVVVVIDHYGFTEWTVCSADKAERILDAADEAAYGED
jgi:hypothetical protein